MKYDRLRKYWDLLGLRLLQRNENLVTGNGLEAGEEIAIEFMKIFIAGTFDNFHIGHQYLCWSAYDLNLEIVIVVARDKTVNRIKKHFPKNNENDRLLRLEKEFQGFENVKIRLGNNDGDFLKTIEEESPSDLLLGYDQEIDISKIKTKFPNLIIKKGVPYFPEFFKSSKF